jgi:HD-GYP domain-containing protein (c-di-GMP phosphodiesterase class II)
MAEILATRLADVLGALSAATDLATGVPMETSLRLCTLATALGAELGLGEDERGDTYYSALLRHLGCTAISHEAASVGGGDDHAHQVRMEDLDRSQLDEPARRHSTEVLLGVCNQAVSLASDLGMGSGVLRALGQMHERFDGLGVLGLRGEAIDPVARTLHVAMLVEVLHRQGGRDRALDEVRRRRGEQLDPAICDLFLADARAFWPLVESTSVWDSYLEAEPGARHLISEPRLDAVALAFARYTDLKTPALLGHSPAVATLVVAAAAEDGLDPGLIEGLRRAALLHDLGLVSVPNGILEKPGPLTPTEWERVRLHAYYTDRVLGRVPALAWVARVASYHHERCDESGYPRCVAPAVTDRATRLLACADSYRALTEARPYRAAFAPAAAATILRTEAREGRLCPRAVDSVLAAAGERSRSSAPPPAEPRLPAGLTPREAEVLVHVARGLTSKEVATVLSISTRTVQHHLEHVYAKAGVSTRAAAALFAVRNDLLSG